MQRLVDVDLQLAAVELDRDRRVAAAQHVGDRGAAGAGARGQRLPHPALEDPRADAVGRELGPERDVGAVGEARGGARSAGRSRRGRAPRARSRVGDADRALRVADRRRAGSASAAAIARRRRRRSPWTQLRAAHVDAAGALAGDRRADLAGGGLDRERVARRSSRARRRYRIASRAPLPDSSASEPSGLKIRSRATKPGSSAGASSSTPSAPTPRWRSHSAPHALGVSSNGSARARRSGSRCPGPATSRSASAGDHAARELGARRRRGVAAGDVDRASTPGSLRIQVSWRLRVAARARLHRLDVAGEQLLEAERLAGGRARRPPRRRGATSSIGAGGDHRVDARVDARVERVAVHRQAGQQRRVARVGRSTAAIAAGGGRRRAPGVEQLERADDALARRVGAIARPRPGRARARARRAARGAPRVRRARPPALADARRRRRAQVELGERGAQVQAGAADDDRRAALRRAARRSRRARARAYSPALNVASTGRNADEPVLEPRPLRARSPRR